MTLFGRISLGHLAKQRRIFPMDIEEGFSSNLRIRFLKKGIKSALSLMAEQSLQA